MIYDLENSQRKVFEAPDPNFPHGTITPIEISGDGRFVLAEYRNDSGSARTKLFLIERETNNRSLVQYLPFGSLGAQTQRALSPDGRFVVLCNDYRVLHPTDTNWFSDIFVWDRLLGTTTLLSANAFGRSGNGSSTRPVMAADGRTVVFQSFASDLAAGDYNDKCDLFVVKLGGVDSDHDGLDDDWEVAYFGNLDRDGAGDFDQDGQTNHQEFLVGTDPTNQGSVFRTMTVAPVGGGNPLILWTGGSDRTYRVEYKDDLGAPAWTTLSGTVSWNGQTGSMVDPGGSGQPQRFYRVVRVP